MHDRRAMRADREAGTAIRAIARSRRASRNAVRRALAPGASDRYRRDSDLERFELAVAEVLADYPLMAVVDVAAVVDWRRSRRHLSSLVARLRPRFIGRPDVDAPEITAIAAGEILELGTMQAGALTW